MRQANIYTIAYKLLGAKYQLLICYVWYFLMSFVILVWIYI